MSEELKTLKEMKASLEELLKWTRFSGMQQLREILTQNLKTDIEMLIFEFSNGERGTREIARLSGMGSNATIASYWKKWSKIGIVEPSTKFKGRYQRICSVEEVGLPLPPMTAVQTSQTESEEKFNGRKK